MKEILASGLPSWLFHTQEGRYSLFIDAVTDEFGPSSYHKEFMQSGKDKRIAEMFGLISLV